MGKAFFGSLVIYIFMWICAIPFHQKNFQAMKINITKNGHANTKFNTNKCYSGGGWSIALQRNRTIH